MTIVAEKFTLLRGGPSYPTGTLVLRHVMRITGGTCRATDLPITEKTFKTAPGGLEPYIRTMRKIARSGMAVNELKGETPDPHCKAPYSVDDRRDLIVGPELLGWQCP